MAYTPDPERGTRCIELAARIDDRLRQYEPGMDRGELTQAVADIAGLTTDEVEDVIDYELYLDRWVTDPDPEMRRISAGLAGSAIAEKAVYGFNTQ